MFGVDVHSVRKVLSDATIRPLGASPEFVFGGAVVDGRLEALVDAARILGEQAEPPPTPHVLLVTAGSSDFALLADGVEEVTDVPADSVQPPPPFLGGDRSNVLHAIVPRERGHVLVLSLERILTSEEIRSLERLPT